MRAGRFFSRVAAAARFNVPQQRAVFGSLAGSAVLMGLAVWAADEQKKKESFSSAVDQAFIDNPVEAKPKKEVRKIGSRFSSFFCFFFFFFFF